MPLSSTYNIKYEDSVPYEYSHYTHQALYTGLHAWRESHHPLILELNTVGETQSHLNGNCIKPYQLRAVFTTAAGCIVYVQIHMQGTAFMHIPHTNHGNPSAVQSFWSWVVDQTKAPEGITVKWAILEETAGDYDSHKQSCHSNCMLYIARSCKKLMGS